MGFHVNVSDLTLRDLERSNQGHPQIKLNIFNFILSTVTQIVLCIFSAPNISNSRFQLSTDCSHSPLVFSGTADLRLGMLGFIGKVFS